MRLRGGGEALALTEDGGVTKEILVEGTGEELPHTHDDVCVHYVGTLQSDGSQFDSSRDRQAPFTFKLGQGKVIKGWDVGVATMKRGEKSILTIRSDYAYGPEGSGDKIPGNATLIFEVELLRWNERDVTADGGVFLKPKDKKGTGWRHPDRNDEVLVQYTGRCHGEVFAQSEGFELVKLGSAESPLPSGVERAICKEMKKGSNAKITCTAKYAFGDAGLEGKVPPGADVDFDVELQDWNAIHDVARDGGIIVKSLGQLDTYGPLCDDAAKVTLTVEGAVLPEVYDSGAGTPFMGPVEKCITVGDGELPEGLERGLEKIKKGQNAVITLAPQYAYGEAGDAALGVPGGATVQFSVQISDVVPTYQLELNDKLAAAERRKEQGNARFKDGNVEAALSKYEKAFKLIQYEIGEGEEGEQVKDLKCTCHLNQAACADKQGKSDECIAQCNKALEIRGSNVKALFRRGKTYAALGQLDEATKDLKQVLALDPANKAAEKQLALVRQKQRVQDSKDKAVFGKMFSKPSPEASRAPPPKPAAAPAEAPAVEPPQEAVGEEGAVEELGDDTRIN